MNGRSPDDEPSNQSSSASAPPSTAQSSSTSPSPPSATQSSSQSASPSKSASRSQSSPPSRSSSAPPAPAGYADPYPFRHSRVALYLFPVPLVLGSSVLFGGVAWLAHGWAALDAVLETTVAEGSTTVTMDLVAVGIPLVVAMALTAVFHELLHGFVLRYYGYDVEYGFSPAAGAFYTVTLGQFVSRDQLLVVSLVPLVVITLVCVPLLVVPVPLVALTAFFVLALNTGGAGGDLYLAWRSLQMPPGTLVYDADRRHSYVYEPRDDERHREMRDSTT